MAKQKKKGHKKTHQRKTTTVEKIVLVTAIIELINALMNLIEKFTK